MAEPISEKTLPQVAMPPIIPVPPTNDDSEPPRRPPRWLIGLIIGLLALGGIGIAATQIDWSGIETPLTDDGLPGLSDAPDTDEPTAEPPAPAGACPFPVKDVPELAFSYGVPDGWTSERDGGTLAIMEDERNLVASFIYTAKLKKDLSATDFLKEFAEVFRTTIEEAGGKLQVTQPSEANDVARAEASATVEEGDLKGIFNVEKAAGFVTLKVYWAPVGKYTQKEPTLQQVVGCFNRKTALTDAELAVATQAKASGTASGSSPVSTGSNPWGSLTADRDGQFSFQAPSSWRSSVSSSAGESPVTQLVLESSAQDASVAFVYNLNRYGVSEPDQFARLILSTFGIQASLGGSQKVSENVDSFDFSGTLGGKSVRGAITIKVEPYFTFYAHYAGIQIANDDLWESYAPTLNQIQSSIRLTEAGKELSSLPALPRYTTETLFGSSGSGSSLASSSRYKQEVEDRASQKWADAMRGYETVESPTTGSRYDAPLNSWNATGPEGAGYYRQLPGGGGLEKLNQLTPSS